MNEQNPRPDTGAARKSTNSGQLTQNGNLGRNGSLDVTLESTMVDSASPPKLHICSTCGGEFKRLGHLRRHENTLHRSEDNGRPNLCKGCGKGFSRKDVLIRHLQTCVEVSADPTLSDPAKRTTRACRTCNELRLKCSGGPVCVKCVELGRECIFHLRTRKSGNKLSPALAWPSPATDLSNEVPESSYQGGSKDVEAAVESDAPLPNDPNVVDFGNDSQTVRKGWAPRVPQQVQIVQPRSEPLVVADCLGTTSHDHGPANSVTNEAPVNRRKKRRKYVTMACLNCQSHKVKCSGEDTCTNCRISGIQCIYKQDRKRQKKRGFEEHENRDSAMPPQIFFTALLDRVNSLENDRDSFKSYMSKHEKSHGNNSRYGDEDGNDSASSSDNACSITNLVSNDVVHGATSLFEPISVLNRTVACKEEEEPNDSPEDSPGSTQPQVAWLSLTRRGKKGIKTLEKETRLRDPEIFHHSVDGYFSRLNPLYPCLNENQFRAQMEIFFSDDENERMSSGDRYQFAALLNLLHAEARILGEDCPDSSSVPGWDEFCCAESILNQIVWLGNGNIWTVHCLIVKARYLLSIERADSAYDTIGQAIRLCIQLGLHNQNAWKYCSPFDIVMRQRLFWTIYCLERHIALNCGAPPLLRETDFKVDLPPDLDDCLMFRDQPLPPEMPERSFGPYLRSTVQWNKLSNEIWDKVFGLHAQKPTSQELLATLDARMVYLESIVPAHLQLSRNASRLENLDGTPIFIIRHTLLLYLRINQLRLFLRQESMLSLQWDLKTAQDCTAIAGGTINAIHAHYYSPSHHSVDRSSSVLYLVGALLPLVCIICKRDSQQQVRESAINGFKKGLTILNHMYPAFGNARHALRRLHKIIASAMRAINDFHEAGPESELLAMDENAIVTNLPNFFSFEPWLDSSIDLVNGQLQIDGSWPFHMNDVTGSDFQGSADDGIETEWVKNLLNNDMLF